MPALVPTVDGEVLADVGSAVIRVYEWVDLLALDRRLDPIAVGRTAEVFAWGDGRVLKLLRPSMPAGMGEMEARAGRIVSAAALAAPRLLETITVDGRFGLVYERVDGRSMVDCLASRPLRIGSMAADFARLHAAMHESSGDGLPELKTYLRSMFGQAGDLLPPDLRAIILARLDELPDGNSISHGDMHPGNVVMTASGPVVIDWMTLTRGEPAADVARTLFLLRDSALPAEMARPQRVAVVLIRRWFASSYLRAYRRLRKVAPEAVQAWRPVILAARLGEGIPAEREPILAELRTTLT
jgi:aminoglycoside phosphotransferase (APT) family kinase protein